MESRFGSKLKLRENVWLAYIHILWVSRSLPNFICVKARKLLENHIIKLILLCVKYLDTTFIKSRGVTCKIHQKKVPEENSRLHSSAPTDFEFYFCPYQGRPCTDYTACNYTSYNSFLLDCVVYSLKKSSLYIKNMKNKWKELIGEHLSSKKEYLASKNILYDV